MAGEPREPEGWVEHTVGPAEAGQTVQQVLSGALSLSRRRLQQLTRSRGIRVNGRPSYLARPLNAGDVVAARTAAPEDSGLPSAEMPLAIVYEDAEVLVLDKPPFVLVHPTRPDQRHTLANGLAHYYREQGLRARIHPVHRLDRDTSGLVLFARTPAAHQRLDVQLRERGIRREYLAFAHGRLPADEGVIDAPIGVHPTQSVLRAVRADGEPARTRYRVRERYAAATLLALELETGRTHQIRVHLAHLGHPLLGDRQYGRRGVRLVARQALHAWRLSFTHPASGERLSFEAALPPDLAALQATLRAGGAP